MNADDPTANRSGNPVRQPIGRSRTTGPNPITVMCSRIPINWYRIGLEAQAMGVAGAPDRRCQANADKLHYVKLTLHIVLVCSMFQCVQCGGGDQEGPLAT
ncbi:hypothetical protein MKOR_07290 [Mycolicibacillus koreensis]|nr:hypothetical protein MKOR_07290 [Mycolicibacillus koreensis]